MPSWQEGERSPAVPAIPGQSEGNPCSTSDSGVAFAIRKEAVPVDMWAITFYVLMEFSSDVRGQHGQAQLRHPSLMGAAGREKQN